MLGRTLPHCVGLGDSSPVVEIGVLLGVGVLAEATGTGVVAVGDLIPSSKVGDNTGSTVEVKERVVGVVVDVDLCVGVDAVVGIENNVSVRVGVAVGDGTGVAVNVAVSVGVGITELNAKLIT